MVDMNEIKLYSNVDSMVKIMPRIETLYYFVYELAQCFHADKDTLDGIKKGILDNQILSKIYLNYINYSGEKVAGVTISIDWDKHKMLAQTDGGKNISVDMSKSVVDNIVSWRKYIVVHIDTIMKQHGATRVSSRYNYRNTITSDDTKYKQALGIMNHVLSSDDTPKAINIDMQNELDNAMIEIMSNDKINGKVIKHNLSCGKLEEVGVELWYKTKK